MTMVDNKCDICGLREPIGVACTAIPYSCAYCFACAKANAQPRIVFEVFFETIGTDFDRGNPDYMDLVTYHEGDYIPYREWATLRSKLGDDHE